jgi:hypothetical protein
VKERLNTQAEIALDKRKPPKIPLSVTQKSWAMNPAFLLCDNLQTLERVGCVRHNRSSANED